MLKRYLLFFLKMSMFLLLLLPVLALYAAQKEGLKIRKQIMARIAKVDKDKFARDAMLKKGRDIAYFCAYCHGQDGNSVKPKVPNLADQDPAYLMDQIEKFADGRRKDYTTVMQQLAKRFRREEKIALVVYYASVQLKPLEVDITLAEKGKPIYLAKCQQCHGEDGRAKNGYARIAGQQPVYVIATLKNFRDKEGGRNSALMSIATYGLSDSDIQVLAAYIVGL
jgi:cytochrome c553